MDRRRFLIWAASAAAAPPRAWQVAQRPATASAPVDDAALVHAFLKRPRDQQHKAMTELRQRLAGIRSPWLARVQAWAARGEALRGAKAPGLLHHSPHAEAASPFAELPCPMRVEYLWGHRVVHALDKRAPLTLGSGRDMVVVPPGSPAEDLVAALRGLHPDTDLALAGALAELDVSGDADQLALFLEGWRNGQESFYRALDRTAGTKEAVFYFDAMLGEFQNRFAPKGTPGGEALKSLRQLHDALHDAFLAYRQYRGMREAAACAAILPVEVPLPRFLARYDSARAGYALRDDLLILAALDGHDPLPGLQGIHATMAPLPVPLWSTRGHYEALPPFQTAFEARLAKAIADPGAGAISSDGLRAAEAAERSAVRARIVALARGLAVGGG